MIKLFVSNAGQTFQLGFAQIVVRIISFLKGKKMIPNKFNQFLIPGFCQNCGFEIVDGAKFCSYCGNKYFMDFKKSDEDNNVPDIEPLEDEDFPPFAEDYSRSINFIAIILGWIVIEATGFVVGLLFSASSGQSNDAFEILLLVGTPLATFIGSYVSAGIAGHHKYLHGIWSTIISFAIAFTLVVIDTGDVDHMMEPEILGAWALGFVFSLIGSSLAKSRTNSLI